MADADAIPSDDLLPELQKVVRLNGDTYSSAEVIVLVKRATAEIEKLRALILDDACNVLVHYDLPEHAFHYRRILIGLDAAKAAARGAKR